MSGVFSLDAERLALLRELPSVALFIYFDSNNRETASMLPWPSGYLLQSLVWSITFLFKGIKDGFHEMSPLVEYGCLLIQLRVCQPYLSCL